MRIRDRGADLAKELKPLIHREVATIAILINRFARDILHDEIRKTVFGRARIKQSRDMRMVEVRENLPLIAKMAQHFFCIHPALDELDRDLLSILIVNALGQINDPHATRAEQRFNLIATNRPTY